MLVHAKETAVFSPMAQTYCQIVVTYRDSNFVWKDRPLDQSEITETEVGTDERTMHCVIPNFWERAGRFSHVEHVGVTLNGHTTQLRWPPSGAIAESPPLPVLSMDIRLHCGAGDTTPAEVSW
jgi:hypothetical protein